MPFHVTFLFVYSLMIKLRFSFLSTLSWQLYWWTKKPRWILSNKSWSIDSLIKADKLKPRYLIELNFLLIDHLRAYYSDIFDKDLDNHFIHHPALKLIKTRLRPKIKICTANWKEDDFSFKWWIYSKYTKIWNRNPFEAQSSNSSNNHFQFSLALTLSFDRNWQTLTRSNLLMIYK